MRKAEEYWNKVSLPFHVLDIVKSKILEAIRTAQIDAIEAACKRCAEEADADVCFNGWLAEEALKSGEPFIEGEDYEVYVITNSILEVANKMKEELE